MKSKSWFVSIMTVAITFGNVTSAVAGTMHAQSTILPKSQSRCAGESGAADASVTLKILRKTYYRVSHEELYSNYTYGNAGNGHAHHHSGTCLSFGRPAGDDGVDSNDVNPAETPPPPILGSQGTSQFIKQTWLPNALPNLIDVAWTPDSFLQVDPSELTFGSRIVSRASLSAPFGLAGTVELSAVLDKSLAPRIDTKLTGIFTGLNFELVSHLSGVISLQFQQPLRWTVPGTAETFDIALEASIGTLAITPATLGNLRRRSQSVRSAVEKSAVVHLNLCSVASGRRLKISTRRARFDFPSAGNSLACSPTRERSRLRSSFWSLSSTPLLRLRSSGLFASS